MKIEKLKYFLDLYDNGSYTQTAKLNYISQTSVTQFINSLEAEYHVKLFNRSTIPITPTEAGKAFYKKASLIYSQYCSSLESMKSFGDSATIPINICYTSPIDIPIILPIVNEFKKQYPEIKVNISRNKIKDTVHALKSMECDIVIGLLNNDEKLENDIKTSVLYHGEYVTVVSKNDPFSSKKSLTTKEAYSHPLILLSPDEIGGNYNAMIEFLDNMGVKPDIKAQAGDLDSELCMVASENLLGFVPDNYPLNYFDDYIVKIPISDYPCKFNLNLTYRDDDNPSIPAFIGILESYSKNK